MKLIYTTIINIALMLCYSNVAMAKEVSESHKDSLEILVKKYYNLNLKTFQVNSTIQDIDNIFQLFSDDFTYIHPKYGGLYTRLNLYDDYVRNQKNGEYNGAITNIKIQNSIIGLNVAVVERIYLIKEKGKIKKGEPKVTLFEFKKGKIAKIMEYW